MPFTNLLFIFVTSDNVESYSLYEFHSLVPLFPSFWLLLMSAPEIHDFPGESHQAVLSVLS